MTTTERFLSEYVMAGVTTRLRIDVSVPTGPGPFGLLIRLWTAAIDADAGRSFAESVHTVIADIRVIDAVDAASPGGFASLGFSLGWVARDLARYPIEGPVDFAFAPALASATGIESAENREHFRRLIATEVLRSRTLAHSHATA